MLVHILILVAIVMAIGGTGLLLQRALKPGPFCGFPRDPNFNGRACLDHSSFFNCQGTLKDKDWVHTEQLCMFPDDADTCSRLGRPRGCGCNPGPAGDRLCENTCSSSGTCT